MFYKKVVICMSMVLGFSSLVLADTNTVMSKQDAHQLKGQLLEKSQHYKKKILADGNLSKKRADSLQDKVATMAEVPKDKLYQRIQRADEMQEHYKGLVGAMMFVSFSMPKHTLKVLNKQAANYGIPVFINGLHKNSFKKTALKVKEIIRTGKDSAEGGIAVDPTWFEMYDIKQVPALVVTKQKFPCTNENVRDCKVLPYDIVYGTDINRGLRVIAKKGEHKQLATSIMKNYKKENL